MKKLTALITALMILVCGCAAAFAEQKTLTKKEAVRIALEYTGLEEEQVRFTKIREERDDGRLVWEIEFVRNGIEYDIDARTGRILEADRDEDDRDDDWDDWFDFD